MVDPVVHHTDVIALEGAGRIKQTAIESLLSVKAGFTMRPVNRHQTPAIWLEPF